ncbi:hypothetical protein pb186bvf_000339 [Paramecium bursaria]
MVSSIFIIWKIMLNVSISDFLFIIKISIFKIIYSFGMSQRSIFRGGGLICSTLIPQETNFQDESIIDQDIIREFFLDLEGKCSNISELSTSIQSQESQDNIIKTIKSISCQSQFINQASRNYGKAREYIKQLLTDLETLLDCITNTIISQRFITLQILKICNQISRLIFQYYANDQSTPLDQERQQSILAIISQIEELLNQGGEQLYYNSIQYELFIIKICIETCPTNSEEGKEVMLNIISGIQASLEELSTDLLTALAQGGLYAYKEIKKRKQRNMFKIIFYLEEFKYKIIEKIQQGQGINKIIKQLVNNYNILIKNSNEWLIKCSWIKIMSELIVYKPIITLKQFQIIKNKHQLQTEWDNLREKRIIKLVDDKQNIGIIQQNDENSNTNRILQQQIIKFQVLQNYLINGEKNLPKLEQLKEFSSTQQENNQQNNQQNYLAIEQLQNLPIGQFILQINEYSQYLLKYIELVQDFGEEIDNKNTNKQYLLQQIEQVISESEVLNNLWYQLLLHNNIIYDVLINFINIDGISQSTNIISIIIINQIIKYFEISKSSDFTFDDLLTEFKTQTTLLQTQYNLDGQIIQKLNTQNVQQYDKVDKLILKLQEINANNKNLITLEDAITYIKMVSIIIKQLSNRRGTLIQYNFNLFNIRSILIASQPQDQNYQTQIIKYKAKNEFFLQMFQDYSAIQTLAFVYEQINNNQDVLIQQALKNQDLKQEIGFSLLSLQLNDRTQELIQNQKYISNQFQSSSQESIDDKISHLNLLELTYIILFRQYNTLITDITNQLGKVEEYIKAQNSQNQQIQIEDQLNENFNQICQDIDNNTFIQLINKRIELYQQLKQDPQCQQNLNLNDDLQLFQLIIEDFQQKYQNVQRQEIIMIIQKQNEKFIHQGQVQIEADKSILQTYQNYLIGINKIIQDNNIVKLQEKSNNLSQGISNIINYLKLQKLQNKQLDQQKTIRFIQIVEEFQSIFAIDLENVTQILQLQIQQQDKKLSLEELNLLVPSYSSLSERVLDYNKKLSLKQKALQFIDDQLTSDVWRIKDYLYFNCLAFHQYLNEDNQKVVGQLLLIARFKETDYRIINTLKGKDQIQQMDALINNQWEDTQDQVNNELQLTLNELQAIQLSLQSEERKDIRDQLLQKHKNLEQQLEQQMKNVTEIGDVLGVTIYFLKDIQRDLASIQNKLDNIINSIDQIGQDIKFLRGKTPQQILEMRMQSILQNKIYQDAQSVYVQMKTLEFDFETNQEKQDQTPLFNADNYKNGEIDEFLTENKKSSLLIHGAAGSGKSLTARKIEEYLWLQYQKQCYNKLWSDIKGTPPLIPIFIQLPTLKEPKFNAIEETLLSSLYRFDQKQIDILKDTAQKNQIRLIFIMDSYDELPQQYQAINLLMTNKVHLWKPQNQLQIPKVITTSRTEAFTTNDYRAWFWENETQGFKSLKELRLLPFNDCQRQEYLEQFSILKLKIQIYELLSVIDKKQDKDQIFSDAEEIWKSIQQLVYSNIQKENRQFLLDLGDIQKLIKSIKGHQNVISFNQEQETSFTKIISKLWHQNLYNQSILQMNLAQLLETPFMLNIIIEVIPLMNVIVSQPNNIKQYFIKNFQSLSTEFLEDLNHSNKNIQLTQDETKNLKELNSNKTKMQNEILEIWEQLINNNFFSNWSIQSTYEQTLEQILRFNIPLFKYLPNLEEEFQIILYKSLKSHKLTLYDFFEKFIEQFIENQRQKLIYSNDIVDQNQFEQDIYKYAIKLSTQMFSRQETVIERKSQGILFRDNNQDPYIQFFEDSDQFGNYRKQIRKCIPIRQKGNYYQFQHKSIQEFLFSKQQMELFINSYSHINNIKKFINHYRQLEEQLDFEKIKQVDNQANLSIEDQRKQETLINILIQIRDGILNQINLQDTFNLGTLKFIKSKMIEELDLYQILEPLVLLSSINQQYIRFSSNCLIILLSVHEYQFNKDFSRIRISEVSLDGAIFEQCNLSQSKFEKVSIKGINLNNSDISNCEWNEIYSYELPSIKVQGSYCLSWISPVGNQILSFSQECPTENQILIWDYKQGIQISSLDNKTPIVYAIYSHDGQQILSYGTDQTMRLWSTQTFIQIKKHKLTDQGIDESWVKFIFSEDDKQIAYSFDKSIRIINNLERLDQVISIELKSKCIAFEFFPAGLMTLCWTLQNEWYKFFHLQTWNKQTGGEIQILTQEIKKMDMKADPYQAIIRNGFMFAVFSDRTIEKWDLVELKQQGSPFKGHMSSITFIDVSKNGKFLVSCGEDKLIIIYDIKSCNAIQTLIGHKQNINIVQFSPESNFLVSCSDDQEIRFWDMKINKEIENQNIQAIEFTPDGKQVVCASKNQIIFFSTKSGLQCDKIFEKYSIICFAIHPNGNLLLYSIGSETKTVDIRLMRQVGQVKQTERSVFKLGYSSDGLKIFLSLSQQSKNDVELVQIYNLNWELIHEYHGGNFKTITVSSNNEYLMDFDSNGTYQSVVVLFELKTFQRKLVQNESRFDAFCLSFDSKQFLGISDQNILSIWNLAEKSNQIKKTQILYGYEIVQLAQGFDQKYVLCGSLIGDIVKFNLITDQIDKIYLGYQNEILKIILSLDQHHFTALSSQPILILWSNQGQDDNYFIAKYINPNKISQRTLLHKLKFDNVKLKSYLDYDIQKLFEKRIIEDQKQIVNQKFQPGFKIQKKYLPQSGAIVVRNTYLTGNNLSGFLQSIIINKYIIQILNVILISDS